MGSPGNTHSICRCPSSTSIAYGVPLSHAVVIRARSLAVCSRVPPSLGASVSVADKRRRNAVRGTGVGGRGCAIIGRPNLEAADAMRCGSPDNKYTC